MRNSGSSHFLLQAAYHIVCGLFFCIKESADMNIRKLIGLAGILLAGGMLLMLLIHHRLPGILVIFLFSVLSYFCMRDDC
jgi:hypothetical protein